MKLKKKESQESERGQGLFKNLEGKQSEQNVVGMGKKIAWGLISMRVGTRKLQAKWSTQEYILTNIQYSKSLE